MTIRSNYEDYVVSDRGGIIENKYNVHAAVVDADGTVLYAVGDPSRMTLARSTAKPVQALAVLETGALDQFGFEDADLALMCASHSSEDHHLKRARDMLAKAGAEETHLRCGGHAALSDEVNRRWIKADFEPTAVCNNCSGKHAGMIAGAKALGADWTQYHLPNNPMQTQVKRVFEEVSGLNADTLKWGIDSCNLPAPACPLHVLAKTYAFFADAADKADTDTDTDKDTHSSPRTQAASRIFNAMAQHPDLIGGTSRFCTELGHSYAGAAIGKLGAAGCYAVGVRAAAARHNLAAPPAGGRAYRPLGIAVKIEDGDVGILYSTVTEILQRLGVGTGSNRQGLLRFRRREVENTVGVVTGHVVHHFKLRRVAARHAVDDD